MLRAYLDTEQQVTGHRHTMDYISVRKIHIYSLFFFPARSFRSASLPKSMSFIPIGLKVIPAVARAKIFIKSYFSTRCPRTLWKFLFRLLTLLLWLSLNFRENRKIRIFSRECCCYFDLLVAVWIYAILHTFLFCQHLTIECFLERRTVSFLTSFSVDILGYIYLISLHLSYTLFYLYNDWLLIL